MLLGDGTVTHICCNPDGLKAWAGLRRDNALQLSVEDFKVKNTFD